MKWCVLTAGIVVTAAACTSTAPTTAGMPAAPPSTSHATPAAENTVTYSVRLTPGECHARDNGTLPDPHCTPGATDPHVTQASIATTICKTGWTATIRPPTSQTNHAKFTVSYPAYGLPRATVAELDHLIPLELGGSSDITNLWPEAGAVPNAKDPVEGALRRDVCAGQETLLAAQKAIADNWHTALLAP